LIDSVLDFFLLIRNGSSCFFSFLGCLSGFLGSFSGFLGLLLVLG